jgi:hypothetical protein
MPPVGRDGCEGKEGGRGQTQTWITAIGVERHGKAYRAILENLPFISRRKKVGGA